MRLTRGTWIENYEIEQVLPGGGFASVAAARERQNGHLGRRIALKIAHAGADALEARRRTMGAFRSHLGEVEHFGPDDAVGWRGFRRGSATPHGLVVRGMLFGLRRVVPRDGLGAVPPDAPQKTKVDHARPG